MRDRTNARVTARKPELRAADDTESDGPPWRFSGVAVAAGDILHMDDGTRVLFTAENLRDAAETQADEPLTRDHPADEDGRPKYPPDTPETAGRVQRAGWMPDEQAVGYEATTHEEDLANGMRAGSFDVSIHPQFRLGEKDPETGAYVAENIVFRDLSVVSKGDSPSNTVEWGSNEAIASLTASDISDGLDTGGAGSGTDDASGITAAVRGVLEAFGVSPSSVNDEVVADVVDDGQSGDEGAESSEGTNGAEPSDKMQDKIDTLADEHGFGRETLEEMSDDDIERLAENFIDGDGDGDGTDGTDTPSDDTLGEMTVDELGEALREQGFVTEENAADVVASATDKMDKKEKIDEIIAESADWDEVHREDLMASADSVVDREYNRLSEAGASQLGGFSGLSASIGAPTPPGADEDGDGEETIDDYGTGVAGDN